MARHFQTTLVAIFAIAWTQAGAVPAEPAAGQRFAGATDGVWYWVLPDTPGGPIQSWSGAGTGPRGEIYVAGMDHATNDVIDIKVAGRLAGAVDQVPDPVDGDADDADLLPGDPARLAHRIVVNLTDEVDELRRRVDTLDQRREGLDPEQLAEVVANRLAPQLDAARRAARTGWRMPR
jgi:hypothetical protein